MAINNYYERINEAALSRCPGLLESFLPGGHMEGNRYHCGGLDGGKGRSLHVDVTSGRWCEENGSESGGDFVSLFAAIKNLKQGEAAKELSMILGLSSASGSNSKNAKGVARYELVGTYVYTDENGQPLFAVDRREGPRGKIFPQKRPDGKGGWIPGVQGIRRVPYKLPEVVRAQKVFICEGEKDVHSILGIYKPGTCAATCNPGGAGKWSDEYSEYLKGKIVFILPDNDKAGEEHAQKVLESVERFAASVRLLRMPGLPEKGDVSDFIRSFPESNLAAQALNKIIDSTPAWVRPKSLYSYHELRSIPFPKQSAVIGGGILPMGCGMIVAGESGVGKSLIRSELAIHLVLGWDYLGMDIPTSRSVFIFQFENTQQTELERIERMLGGLDVRPEDFPKDKLYFSDPRIRVDLGSVEGLSEAESIIKESGCEVVIFDPLTSLHGVNENDNAQMRRILDNLTEVGRKTGVTIILVHHFGKPGKEDDGNTRYRERGASSIRDWADTLIAVSHKKDNFNILRKWDFSKVRNGPEPKGFIFERSRTSFLSKVTEDNSVCSHVTVADVVKRHGGRIVGAENLHKIIHNDVGCPLNAARDAVKKAVDKGTVKETSDPSHQQRKIYSI